MRMGAIVAWWGKSAWSAAICRLLRLAPIRAASFPEGAQVARCPQATNAFSTCFGSFRMARNRARAGPVGSRRPCSQLRRVPTSTASTLANLGCDRPVAARISLMLRASTWNSRDGARSRRPVPRFPEVRQRVSCPWSAPLIDDGFQRLLLSGSQVIGDVLRVGEQQGDLRVAHEVVVDDAGAAALAATFQRKANLPEAAGALDGVAGFGVVSEEALELGVLFIRHQLGELACEHRRLDEDH